MAEQKEIENPRIKQIDCGLSRYYGSYGWPYDALFSNTCDDGGLNDDDLEHEYNQDDPTQSQLLFFAEPDNDDDDYDFPFDNQKRSKQQQAEYILDILQKCDRNKDIAFDITLPKFDKEFFEITQEEFEGTKQLYSDQCPVLYNSGLGKDLLFLQMLTICRKAKCNYFQLLVDDYLRCRVEKFVEDNKNTAWKIKQWTKDHKHFRKLKKIELPAMPKFDEDDQKTMTPTSASNMKLETAADFVEQCVYLFRKRLCPELSLKPIYLINDSIEIIVKYIYAGYKCVGNFITEGKRWLRTCTPLQFDMCIALKEPKNTKEDEQKGDKQNDDDDDDDDDDDKTKPDESKQSFTDSIGDIKKKFKANDLEFYEEMVDTKKMSIQEHQRIFTLQVNKIEHQNKDKVPLETKKYFLQNKRFIGFVDRRKIQQIDPVYLFLPPKGQYTRDIPNNAVPEWYIASSRTTLLPNISFNMEEAIGADDTNKDNDNGNDDNKVTEEDKLKNQNVTTNTGCCGSVLTLSFHLKTEEDMAVYLYYDGKMTRFHPDDIANLLPTLFNPEYENEDGTTNAQYLQTNDFKHMIEDLKETVTKMTEKSLAAFRDLNK